MKVNLRDNQVAAWQRLAELIGGRTPSDAVAYMGVRHLPTLIDQLEKEAPSPPVVPTRSDWNTVKPNCSKSEQSEPKTGFDDLFDSIEV